MKKQDKKSRIESNMKSGFSYENAVMLMNSARKIIIKLKRKQRLAAKLETEIQNESSSR